MVGAVLFASRQPSRAKPSPVPRQGHVVEPLPEELEVVVSQATDKVVFPLVLVATPRGGREQRHDVHEARARIDDEPTTAPPEQLAHRIRRTHISYRYPLATTDAVHDLNLDLPAYGRNKLETTGRGRPAW